MPPAPHTRVAGPFAYTYIVSIPTSASPYLQALQNRVLVFDGAMGTSIQNYDLTAEVFGGTLVVC